MSLMMRCIETYDAMEHLAGKQDCSEEMLAPIGHVLENASIEIIVDEKGEFVSAKNIDKQVPILCTEASATRNADIARPLCDELYYISKLGNPFFETYKDEQKEVEQKKNANRHKLYVDGLKKWNESEFSCNTINAIYKYVSKETLYSDLVSNGVQMRSGKDIVVWRITGISELSGAVYEKPLLDILAQKHNAYENKNESKKEKCYCMVTGKMDFSTEKYPFVLGTAKLISKKEEDKNFVYKGRLLKSDEAFNVGREATQKGFAALKWLIKKDGVMLDKSKKCIAWNPKGKEVPSAMFPLPLLKENANENMNPTRYKKLLLRKIFTGNQALSEMENVIIAIFDSASPGRAAVTYYSEIEEKTFIERLVTWDLETMFPTTWNRELVPSLYEYVAYAFGTYRGKTGASSKGETNERKKEKRIKFEFSENAKNAKGQQMQRLIVCKIERRTFPLDVMNNLVFNASRLYLYDSLTKEKLLHVTCSAIRKYHIDKLQEDILMALEKEKKNRSYQYGRLLAVLEKVEQDTYDEKDAMRETNAIRLQQRFVQKPLETSEQIIRKLKQAYYRKLKKSSITYYEKLIEEILCVVSECEGTELDKSLDEMYLIGYYLQKQDFYKENNSSEGKTVISD